jgi:hypothetical protein
LVYFVAIWYFYGNLVYFPKLLYGVPNKSGNTDATARKAITFNFP